MTKTAYAPEELTREAYKLLSREKARLSGLNYTPYKGTTVSPMSNLTERARNLQEQFSQKPLPYSNKIQSVLSRENQGITPNNVQDLLKQLERSQQTFSQNSILGKLQNEFRNAIQPRLGELGNRIESDIGRYLPEAQGTLENLAKMSGNLESLRNRQTASTLQNLQTGKQTKREELLKNLKQFGSQKQAYNNMVTSANKGQFDTQVNEPYRKIQLLEQALRSTGINPDEPLNRDLAQSQIKQIAQALRAYGVEPSNPPSQWDSTRTQSPGYTGQLVANLPSEIEASGNILGRLDPKFRDNYTDQRKELTKSLLDNPNLSTIALQKLNPAMEGKISMLEQSAGERMKKDLEALGNQYIKLGQYRSPQHLKAAEERALNLNRSVLEERNKILQESLRNELGFGHEAEIDKIKQLGQIGSQSQKDYGNLLKTLRDTNRLGAEKFSNRQAENEDLYRNYQNENLWQWPHMRGGLQNSGIQGGIGEGRSGALGDIFGGLGDRNISLDNLANLNTRYSELEKEQPVAGNPITQTGDVIPQMQQELMQQRQGEATREQQRQVQEAERLKQLELARQKQQQAQTSQVRQAGIYDQERKAITDILKGLETREQNQNTYRMNAGPQAYNQMITNWLNSLDQRVKSGPFYSQLPFSSYGRVDRNKLKNLIGYI